MELGRNRGKQKPRSCRAQDLARSSAQGNEWQKKAGLLNREDRCRISAELSEQAKRNRKNQPCHDCHSSHNGARFKWLLRFAAVTSGWPTTQT